MAKQPLPYNVTKAQLYTMYQPQFQIPKIRRIINAILEDETILPNLKERPKKTDNNIPHEHFMEFVKTVGLPDGYFQTDND